MIVTVGFVLLLLFASNPVAAAAHHPIGIFFGAVAIAAFVMSVRSLNGLRLASTALNRRRLWQKSLYCHVIIVLIVVASFGFGVGLTLSITEIFAIALHVYALVA